MWRILGVIGGNVARGPATVRLPGRVPAPEGFHGAVAFDGRKCLACGVCAYVCVSGAIEGVQEERAYLWSYEPGRCAYCARCVERCPGKALSMGAQPSACYTRPGALAARERVAFPACPECGAPARPVTAELVRRAFASADEALAGPLRLCERCRRRRLQRGLASLARPGETKEGA